MASTLRSCIIAEEDYTFLSLDASQLELRVLAILSRDPQMLEDLKTGDLHLATAIRMYGQVENKEEMKRRRYDAKQANFALVYSADSFKLSEMLDCSIEEAKEFMGEHRVAYPTLYQWMEEEKKKAMGAGYVVNMYGRIRPLPDLYAGSERIRSKALREVVNTIVQGGAVDTFKLMMLHLRRIFDRSIRLVLSVHDEMVFEVPDSMLAIAIEQTKTLNEVFPDYPCSVSTGKVYGELEDVPC